MVGTPKFNVDTRYPQNSQKVEAGGTIFPGRTIIFDIWNMVVSQNGWLIMENPIKMGDLGVPPFKETPIYILYIP